MSMAIRKSFLRRNWRTLVAAGSLGIDALIITIAFLFAVRVDHPGIPLSVAAAEHPAILLLMLGAFLGFFTTLGVYRTTAQSSFYRQAYLAGKGFVYSVAVILSVLFGLRR